MLSDIFRLLSSSISLYRPIRLIKPSSSFFQHHPLVISYSLRRNYSPQRAVDVSYFALDVLIFVTHPVLMNMVMTHVVVERRFIVRQYPILM